jgi:hypothetical protein
MHIHRRSIYVFQIFTGWQTFVPKPPRCWHRGPSRVPGGSLLPNRQRWNEAKIFAHMLFAYPSSWDNAAGGERYVRSEDSRGNEDALGMMAQRAMPEGTVPSKGAMMRVFSTATSAPLSENRL